MENQGMLQVDQLTCYNCRAPMKADDIFCPECGYPENGTDKEKAQFHAKNAMQKNKHMDADKKIQSARNVLYVMSGIVLIVGFISFFIDQDIATLITNGILGIIYLLLGSWTTKKPLMAILLGLLLYLTTIIIAVILEPESIFKGILFKVLIIAYLVKGVYSASTIKSKSYNLYHGCGL